MKLSFLTYLLLSIIVFVLLPIKSVESSSKWFDVLDSIKRLNIIKDEKINQFNNQHQERIKEIPRLLKYNDTLSSGQYVNCEIEIKNQFNQEKSLSTFSAFGKNINLVPSFMKTCTFRNIDTVIESFDYYFSKYIFFQNESVKEMKSLLLRKLLHPDEPIVIHLAGDHGLGKTLSSKLFSRVLFKSGSEVEGDGLFLISGEDYKIVSDVDVKKKIELQREKLFNAIAAQLSQCSYSVIVIDEIQKVHKDILSVLEPFFDGQPIFYHKTTGATHKIESSKATYIMTSDFEKQGMASKSASEIKELVSLFFKSFYSKQEKLTKLVTSIIPFLPPKETDMKSLFIDKILYSSCRHYPTKSIDIFVDHPEKIASILYARADLLYSKENFRAIEKVLYSLVYDRIDSHILQLDQSIHHVQLYLYPSISGNDCNGGKYYDGDDSNVILDQGVCLYFNNNLSPKQTQQQLQLPLSQRDEL
ncbi:hypothetical protein CYY_005418 [Polysphondylium violaceum]|uniref:AAA+ ATPase domain-containing protein n=1 Tax=Polysphondylium violaceum TaxID=133409 RepID=A0A8J4Q346_9MYCE|nr:hypothetical protein CYY_005418 [Polysphondylium violaceum]